MPSVLSPEITDASRREFLALLGAAGLLVGCSSATNDATSTSGTGYPRTVEHSGGTVTLPGPPQRVFLGDGRGALDDLLALGITPVAISMLEGEVLPSWSLARGPGNIPIIEKGQLDLEDVAAQAPDLSVVYAELADSPVGAQLSGLASLAVIPDLDDYAGRLNLYGQLFAVEDRAAAVRTDTLTLIADWNPPRRPSDVTLFFAIDATQAFVYNPGSTGMAGLLAAAGLTITDRGRPADEFGFMIAEENFDQLEADLLVAVEPYPGVVALNEVEASPLFARLPAVADGRYSRLTTEESQAVLTASSLSIPYALDVFTRVLG